jgi:two-component system, NarL family, nitrate/nitrite response regulator NarL
MIKVAIVDDECFARDGLAGQIQRNSDQLALVGVFASVADLLADPDARAADVIILDVLLGPGHRFEDNIRAITEAGPKILAVTSLPWWSEIGPALRNYPISVYAKNDLSDTGLRYAIRAIADGYTVVAPEFQDLLRAQQSTAPSLSERQQQVFTLWSQGLPLKSIARRLGIVPDTAHEHLQAALKRFHAAGHRLNGDLLAAHYKAIELGYIPDPRHTGNSERPSDDRDNRDPG